MCNLSIMFKSGYTSDFYQLDHFRVSEDEIVMYSNGTELTYPLSEVDAFDFNNDREHRHNENL